MPRVVITHAVEDIDRWLQGKAERAAAIESGTGSNVTDYITHDRSNKVAVTADVADLAALTGMLTSPPPEILARDASARRRPTNLGLRRGVTGLTDLLDRARRSRADTCGARPSHSRRWTTSVTQNQRR